MASPREPKHGSIQGLEDEEFVANDDVLSCHSMGQTPKAFAFNKRGMFPKEQQEGKEAEELVEIKPRQREQDVEAGQHRSSMDASAFDDTPAAETYDPSWTTTPLRAEAGQLGKNNGQASTRASLLPNAFTLESSADLEEDEEDDEFPDSLDQLGESTSESLPSSPQSPHSGKSIYSKGKRGAMSFLARKKKESIFTLFHVPEKSEDVCELLQALLQTHYNGISSIRPETATKTTEIRSKVKFASDDGYVMTYVVISIEKVTETAGMTKVTLRRHKSDKAKSSQQALHSFCVELTSRYISAKPEVLMLKCITAEQSNEE